MKKRLPVILDDRHVSIRSSHRRGESWISIDSDIEGSIIDFAYSRSGEIILTTSSGTGTYKSRDGLNFEQTSIGELSNMPIRLYPNPVSGTLFLSIPEGQVLDYAIFG